MTQLINAMEDWTKHIGRGHPVEVEYLDFRKAFGSVPHERLLLKLRALGITGHLHL